MRSRGYIAAAGFALAAAATPASAHHADLTTTIFPAGSTQLISRSLTGQVPDAPSRNPAISWDQRVNSIVAFESDADNIVANDPNRLTDVYAVLRGPRSGDHGTPWVAGRTQLVSAGLGGQPANGRSYLPAADGSAKDLAPHCVGFISDASNLVPGDTNGVADAFVRDLRTGVTTRVSVNSAGQQANGPSFEISLSGDCGRVAFTSAATNLALRRTRTLSWKGMITNGTPAGRRQVYVHVLKGGRSKDRSLERLTFLASAHLGRAGNGNSSQPNFARTGKGIVFTSTATNLDRRDRSGGSDVYLVNLDRKFRRFRGKGAQSLNLTGRLVSANPRGAPGNGASSQPTVTDDRRYVAYETVASNLVSGDSNGASDILRADLRGPKARQLRISKSKTEQARGASNNPEITASGNSVFFDSDAPNLRMFPGFLPDPNGVRDMMAGIVGLSSSGVESLNFENHFVSLPSAHPAVSARNNYVLFESAAPNLDKLVRNPGVPAIYMRYEGPK